MLSDNFSSNTLRPIFSHALALKLETLKLDAFIQNYSTGQTLSGKVVQIFPEQKALVEIQGEKLLLQFPRAINPGQNIAIKIEQTQPSLILKLTDAAPPAPLQKTGSGNLAKDTLSLNTQGSDKTSIQNRSVDNSQSRLPGSTVSESRSDLASPGKEVAGLLSKSDLKELGLQAGQKERAEVLRVVDRTTIQVRYNNNELVVKHEASQKFQLGDPVSIFAKALSSEKFLLTIERINASSSSVGTSPDQSILKDYLPARQPLFQVLTGLKEAFLEGASTSLKELNMNSTPLKQLQANLQTIVSRELKVPEAARLKEIIDRSGFHYEAKIKDFLLEPGNSKKNALLENDLKGQLLRLGQQLEQLPGGKPEHTISDKLIAKLMSQVNQAISNIELQQLVHHFSKEEQHPLLLQLPENLLSEEDRFKIYILPDQREEAGSQTDLENRAFNLVFLLNLSALGDLRIETKVFKEEISIHIMGSNTGAVEFIQEHVPELEKIFQQEGFSITVSSSSSTEFSMEVPDSLGQLLIDTPLQIVDLKT